MFLILGPPPDWDSEFLGFDVDEPGLVEQLFKLRSGARDVSPVLETLDDGAEIRLDHTALGSSVVRIGNAVPV